MKNAPPIATSKAITIMTIQAHESGRWILGGIALTVIMAREFTRIGQNDQYKARWLP